MLSPPAMIRNMFGACYCIDDNTSSTDISSTTDDTNSTKSEEKIMSDISRNKAVRQHMKKVYQNSNHELQGGEDGSKELQELLKKKSKPLSDDEKKQLYLEKLKWVSMKHM